MPDRRLGQYRSAIESLHPMLVSSPHSAPDNIGLRCYLSRLKRGVNDQVVKG